MKIPLPLLFFPDDTEHTQVGVPAPLHLPAAPDRKASYVERYPPRLDAPVTIELAPADDDAVIVEVRSKGEPGLATRAEVSSLVETCFDTSIVDIVADERDLQTNERIDARLRRESKS